MAIDIIDTHVHVWNFAKADYAWLKGNTTILNRNHDIEALEKDRLSAGVSHGVLVQAANNEEDTAWMLEVASKTSWIAGVVGWLPLADAAATERALTTIYLKDSRFKGVRHLIHDESDPRWLLQPGVLESLKLLAEHDIPYDVVGVLPAHIETALEVAAKVPGLRMVFDHLNQPPIARKEKFGRWGELMQEAAQYPGFYMKISGLGTCAGEAGWNPDDLKPYLEFIIRHFTAERCCCGGDWPVSLLAGDYVKTWEVYKETLALLLPPAAQHQVLFENARLFYKLDV